MWRIEWHSRARGAHVVPYHGGSCARSRACCASPPLHPSGGSPVCRSSRASVTPCKRSAPERSRVSPPERCPAMQRARHLASVLHGTKLRESNRPAQQQPKLRSGNQPVGRCSCWLSRTHEQEAMVSTVVFHIPFLEPRPNNEPNLTLTPLSTARGYAAWYLSSTRTPHRSHCTLNKQTHLKEREEQHANRGRPPAHVDTTDGASGYT